MEILCATSFYTEGKEHFVILKSVPCSAQHADTAIHRHTNFTRTQRTHQKWTVTHMKYQIIERVKIQRIHLQVIKTITSAIRTIQSGAT